VLAEAEEFIRLWLLAVRVILGLSENGKGLNIPNKNNNSQQPSATILTGKREINPHLYGKFFS
jgi:hypothetical protein